jgi:hypothetical protein
LFHSLFVLMRLPSEMLELPTSSLKVALQFVDASVISCPGPNMNDGNGSTPLHWICKMSDPSQEHTLENQCILAKQLIEAGANVNARAQHRLHERAPCTMLAAVGFPPIWIASSCSWMMVRIPMQKRVMARLQSIVPALTHPERPSSCLRTRTRLILTFSRMMDGLSSPRFVAVLRMVKRDFHTIRTRKLCCFR